MRWLRAFLICLLAFGAALPACAGAACEQTRTAPAHHHAMTTPGHPKPAPVDHHAVACIGCAVDLPDAVFPEPAAPIARTMPTAAEPNTLHGRTLTAPLPPPRLA